MVYAIVVIIAIIAIFVIVKYNSLVALRQRVKNSWSQIDVQLKRRNDLLPNLIETVKGYAKYEGSAAAPTAGLHFTKELLDEIRKKGVNVVFITLHVGLGTFRPVSVTNIKEHHMHSEYYEMSEEVANILNETKKNGKRIISVGTTSTRTLETVMTKYNTFKKCFGNTDIFIYPGYKFKAVDVQITNFHLPKSTLVMLVSAFASREIILNAYKEAVNQKYRFFSFGDAMIII